MFTVTVVLFFSVDFENRKVSIQVLLGKGALIGDYIMDGKIMILPVTGNGPFNITVGKMVVFNKVPLNHHCFVFCRKSGLEIHVFLQETNQKGQRICNYSRG